MTIEQRLRHLEDLQAISSLTYRYAQAVNKGPNGNGVDVAAIPELFTTDARWSSADLGTTIGSAGIIAELSTATANVEFSAHAFLNPVIDVNGDSADGTWLLWIASVHDRGTAAVYLSANLGYLRTVAGWRIDSVNVGDGIRVPIA